MLLTIYRVAAYLTGTGLVLLTCVAMPVKYIGGEDTLVTVVGITHGYVFAAYVVIVLLLAYAHRWPVARAMLVLLAGVVPFLTFFVERRVVRQELQRTRTAHAASQTMGEDADGPLSTGGQDRP